MNKTLNIRYLVRLLAGLAIVLVAIWTVHRVQAGKQTGAFLHQADVAEQENKPGRAVGYLRRYLVMKPNDTGIRARLALLLADNARTKVEYSQAFVEMEEVLRQDPGRDDIRRREIPLMMSPGPEGLRMFSDARDRLITWTETTKNDGTLYDLLGQCHFATGDNDKAIDAFKTAIQLKPDLIPAYGRLAFLQKKQPKRTDADVKKLTDADDTIGDLVRDNPRSAAAHLLAASYWKDAGKQADYESELKKARECDSEDPEVVLAIAGLAESHADGMVKTDRSKSDKLIEDASTLLRQAIDKRQPEATAQTGSIERDKHTRLRGLVATMMVTLSRFELRLSRVADAERTVRQAVNGFPEFAEPILKLAEICILQNNWDEAGRQLDDLEKKGYPASVVNYHRGRILMGQEQWCAASRSLEQAANDTPPSAPLMRQIQFLLGNCYDRTGLLDRRLEAYKLALPPSNDDSWLLVSMRVGGALVEIGRAAEAKPIFREVAKRFTNANIPLARLLLAEVLRKKNPTSQDFAPIEELLNKAPTGVEREMFRADLALAMKKKPDEVRTALENAKREDAKAIEPWAALAYFEWRQNDAKQAESILDEAKAKFGDRALFRLIRGRIIATGKPEQVAEALVKLAAGSENLEKDERRRLLRGLAEIAQGAGQRELADQFWEQLATEWPDNLGVHLVRFDNAMRANNEKRMDQAMEAIARLDLDNGTSTRIAKSLRIIWKARQKKMKDIADLDKAEAILSDLELDRPVWGRIPLAQAVILELKGPSDLSLERYRRAFDLGERDPELLRRLVEIYMEQGRADQANAVMQQWPEGMELGEGFQQVVAEVSLQSRDFKKALDLAEKAVPENEQDYRKQIWLSRLQWMAGKGEAARKPLDRAIKLAPQRPEAWVTLVQYFTLQGQKAEANETIKELEERINPADKALALAECYEIVGDFGKAGEYYQRALTERPDDLKALKNAAGLRLREGKGEEAKNLLYRILENSKRSEEDERFAKRLMTIILALNPDYEARREWLEREGLLEKKPLSGKETVEEIRTRAFALALQRDLRSLSEAIRLLRELDSRVPLRNEDKFLLAQLHAGVSDGMASRRVMAALLQSDGENALYITFYVKVLIREQQLNEAESWVAKLEAMKSVPPRTFETRAQLYAAKKDIGKAAELLRNEAEKPGAELARIAAIMEEVGAGAAAEPLYVKIKEKSKLPEAGLTLALYYGRQNHLEKALEWCHQTWDVRNVNKETVCSAYVVVLYSVSNPPQDKIEQVAVRVEELLNRSPSHTMFSNMAAIRNLQRKYADAIVLYRDVLKRNPKDSVALNNLAYLLSANNDKHSEALTELQKAISSFGRLPTLLDTQAQVYIAMGEAETAIELLNEAIALEPRGSHYFHLAQAYQQKQKQKLLEQEGTEAKDAWNRAQIAWNQADHLKLKKSDLHPLEHEAYEKLKKEFQPR